MAAPSALQVLHYQADAIYDTNLDASRIEDPSFPALRLRLPSSRVPSFVAVQSSSRRQAYVSGATNFLPSQPYHTSPTLYLSRPPSLFWRCTYPAQSVPLSTQVRQAKFPYWAFECIKCWTAYYRYEARCVAGISAVPIFAREVI